MIADGGYAGANGETPGYVKLPEYQCNLLWALVNCKFSSQAMQPYTSTVRRLVGPF